jgi:DNA-binding response OmpR family regulator
MKRILVVDDEKNIQELYKTALEAEGYEVSVSNSGKDAQSRLEGEQFDLIILDIRMPELNGVEFLKDLRSKEPNLPVLICSAYPMYKNDFFTWLADDFIVKSPDLTELKQKVKKLLAE